MRADGLNSAGAESGLESPPAFHVIVLVSTWDYRSTRMSAER